MGTAGNSNSRKKNEKNKNLLALRNNSSNRHSTYICIQAGVITTATGHINNQKTVLKLFRRIWQAYMELPRPWQRPRCRPISLCMAYIIYLYHLYIFSHTHKPPGTADENRIYRQSVVSAKQHVNRTYRSNELLCIGYQRVMTNTLLRFQLWPPVYNSAWSGLHESEEGGVCICWLKKCR